MMLVSVSVFNLCCTVSQLHFFPAGTACSMLYNRKELCCLFAKGGSKGFSSLRTEAMLCETHRTEITNMFKLCDFVFITQMHCSLMHAMYLFMTFFFAI